ncbi:hypothetical protein ACLMJK_001175 [Lecanora helva]
MSPIDSISLIINSYHEDIYESSIGISTRHLLITKLVERLQSLGYTVHINDLEPADALEEKTPERRLEVVGNVARAVASAIESKSFPIVLSDSDFASVGVAAGLSSHEEDFDVIWFGADFHSPDEHASGTFEGTGLSMIVGEGSEALRQSVPGWRPVPLGRMTFCGMRGLSNEQQVELERVSARVVGVGEKETESIARRLGDALDDMAGSHCHVHIDLNCLGDSVDEVDGLAAPRCLSKDDLLECLEVTSRERMPIALTVIHSNSAREETDKEVNAAVSAISRLMLLLKHEEWQSG